MRALGLLALVFAACVAPPIPLIDAGTPVPNRCVPTPDDVAFGVLTPGVAETRTILVRNPTQETLVIAVGEVSAPFTLESGRFKLAAGQQQPLKVSVQTTDALAHLARVTFSGGLACEPTSFLLSARTVGQLTVSPPQLDFGNVGIGETKTLAVVLTNSTDHDVRLIDAISTNAVFTAAVSTLLLGPRQSSVVQVEARPVVFGTTQATLVLTGSSFTRGVPLQVNGGRAIAQLEPEVIDVPLVPFFPGAPSESFVARTVLLRNLAPPVAPPNAALRITGPLRVEAIDGGLEELCVGAWSAAGCAAPGQGLITGGQALTVPVRISPTSEGPRQWRVTFPTNDALAPNQQVLITATAARPGECQLDVTPRTLVLGAHPAGTPGVGSLTFHNTGSTPCFVDSLALVATPDGDADGGFAPVSPATVELDGGASFLVIDAGSEHVVTVSVTGRFPNSTVVGQVGFHVLRADSGVEAVPFMMQVQ